MIQCEGVEKSFGRVRALAPLDLELSDHEWLGVFGRNGSGKTTLLRILVGLSRPTGGRVLLDGREPTARDWLELHRRLGFMPERIVFHEDLTGRATLRYYARLRGVGAEEVERVLDRVRLVEAAGRRIAGYSKGMLQRLNLAQALLGDPEILVLDEPIEGLDPHGVREFFELLHALPRCTVVLSSHQLPRIAGIMDRICILKQGRMAALGDERELVRRLDLPLRVTLLPSAEVNGHLEDRLRAMGARRITRSARGLELEVPRDLKLRFLGQLPGLEREIVDLRLDEPSLEDVFLETD